MDFKIPVTFSLFLFLPFAFIQAQENLHVKSDTVYQLQDVVVSAYRYESSLLNTASSITVITSDDIQSSNKSSILDILRNEYGLSYTQLGGPGKLATVNLRGASASHTLVLIDGIEMNMPSDPGTVYDFANLPLNNVERIEILRGPQSTLYGSDAMAGVINIITKEPAAGPSYFITGEGGKYKTYSGSAGLSGVLNNFDYLLSVSGMSTDGFSSASERYGNFEKDGAQNNIYSSKIGYRFNDNIKLNLSARFTKADADYDQFGGAFGDDPTYVFNMEETVARPELNMIFGKWDQKIGISYYRVLRKYSFDSTAAYYAFSNSFYDGKKYKIDWLNNYRFNETNILSFGVDLEKENAVSSYREYNSLTSFESNFPENEMNTAGLFLQYNNEVFNNFFISGGVRNDIHNRFGSIITYRIAPVYFHKATGTKIKGTFGTGFKTPSLFNLYDPNFGNKDLDPEKTTGWDAGIEQYIMNENFTIGLTYFRSVYKNLFGTDENFRTININEAKSEGIEVFYTYQASNKLRMRFNYTYTKSTDENPLLESSERRLLRRPEDKAGFNLNYQIFSNTGVNFEFIYIGSRKDKDFSSFPAAVVILNTYTLLNFSASYKPVSYLEFYTRLDNILDEKYEEIYGYGVPGFGLYGGFKLNF